MSSSRSYSSPETSSSRRKSTSASVSSRSSSARGAQRSRHNTHDGGTPSPPTHIINDEYLDDFSSPNIYLAESRSFQSSQGHHSQNQHHNVQSSSPGLSHPPRPKSSSSRKEHLPIPRSSSRSISSTKSRTSTPQKRSTTPQRSGSRSNHTVNSPPSKLVKQRPIKANPNLFQTHDFPSVSVRPVDLASRTAFERFPAMIPPGTVIMDTKAIKKISPSPSHMEVLDRILGQTHARQLHWSSSTDTNADIFPNHKKNKNKSQADKTKYSSINKSTYLKSLPNHKPTFSTKKRRLPMRPDVGFPHPKEEEIKIKLSENQKEAELEETSPRIVMLAHSVNQPQKNLQLNSIFAPPLDASFSSTYGWRPRPFSDRPTGTTNLVVSVVDVQFDLGDFEPLVCSLSLYCLPSEDNLFTGKVSEDFYFPAGDWAGLLKEEAAKDLARQLGITPEEEDEENQLWRKRKKKALFSYDPLLLPNKGKDCLYIVMQLYKTFQQNGISAYLPQETTLDEAHVGTISNSKIKSFKKKHLFRKTNMRKNLPLNSFEERVNAQAKAMTTFKKYGTQFLTPMGFGIVPVLLSNNSLFENDCESVNWPEGDLQTIQIYSFPSIPDSSEDFIERLTKLINQTQHHHQNHQQGDQQNHQQGIPSIFSSPSALSEKTSFSQNTDTDLSFTSNYSQSSHNIFKTPKTKRKKKVQVRKEVNHMLTGNATLFLSTLGVDFTQVMLQTPKALSTDNNIDDSDKNENITHSRLLVDVSGDCAIMMMNPETMSTSSSRNSSSRQRRSDLVRLPRSKLPSGYSDSSEVREVLCLPPRDNSNRYDLDVFSKSYLNLLYLYPKQLIKCSKREDLNDTGKSYSVRIRLIQQGSQLNPVTGENEQVFHSMETIYNPAPGGKPLLSALYTSIHHSSRFIDVRTGISMRDEVKIRLPTILDGSHFIQFSLVSLSFQDDGSLFVDSLAETHIPLSNTSTQDPTTLAKVTTVIPNALHRIKLGNFQLQVETRLCSTIHISNPSIAVLLRDFPYTKGGGASSERSLGLNGKIVPYLNILNNANQQGVIHHFVVLVFMFMCNLVNNGAPGYPFSKLQRISKNDQPESALEDEIPYPGLTLLMENMTAILQILHLVKSKFLSCQLNSQIIDKFFKDFWDYFDESLFSLQPLEYVQDSSHAADSLSESSAAISDKRLAFSNSFTSTEVTPEKFRGGFTPTAQTQIQLETLSEMSVEAMEEKVLEAAVLVVVQQFGKYSKNNSGFLDENMASASNQSFHRDAPFSRRAYGVSKTERMRAEAELDEEKGRFARLWEDDETIMSTDTWNNHHVSHHPVTVGSTDTWADTDDNMSLDLASAHSYNDGTRGEQNFRTKSTSTIPSTTENTSAYSVASNRARSFREKLPNIPTFNADTSSSLAKRVNSVAQVMIAPCMAPSLTTVLASGHPHSPIKSSRRAFSELKDAPTITNATSYIQTRNDDDGNSELNVGVKQVITSPGSDIEDEDDFHLDNMSHSSHRTTSSTILNSFIYPDAPKGIKLRGNPRHLHGSHLEFSFSKDLDNDTYSLDNPDRGRPFLYETVFALWLYSWMEYVTDADEKKERVSSELNKTFSESNLSSSELECYNPFLHQAHTYFSFVAHMDFLVPLCLKSLVLRCSTMNPGKHAIPLALLDKKHMQILDPMMKVWAQGLMLQSLLTKQSHSSSAIKNNDAVCNFLIGLFAVIHPAQVSFLIEKYVERLRDFEDDNEWGPGLSGETKSKLSRTFCSRRLRLHVLEKLSTVPQFIALNYPLKYPSNGRRHRYTSSSWTNQSREENAIITDSRAFSPYADGVDRTPRTHWLAELLVNEAFSICGKSCESMVAEALAQMKSSQEAPVKNQFSKNELLQMQSIAVHAITCTYDMLIRRHSTDSRFQTEEGRARIAGMFAVPVIQKSVNTVQCLAKMEGSHKVRIMWLLCFLYVLQEAPENLVREQLRKYCMRETSEDEFMILKFIKLMKLCSSTFQSFIGGSQGSNIVDCDISVWLVQESFNIVCATTNIVVDECPDMMMSSPHERKRMAQGILDLLLHVITTPQSSVTHLRALGGASQALDKFGAALFFEVVGDNLQHWARVIFTLMNSTALSVRSIAVDFTVSLLGGIFNEIGNMDEIALVFLSILPEVVAREIALYSVCDQIKTMADVENALWPIRRALADVEEANPIDDDRVDVQLAPILGMFCRTCQAVIDGVFIELRLMGNTCEIAGSRLHVDQTDLKENSTMLGAGVGKIKSKSHWGNIFDADEESLFEAANFFLPETAPLQRMRWLMTLKSLHEAKGQWVEAAETLLLCARTISDAIPHVNGAWRPSRFALWHDSKRSLWLSTIGEAGRNNTHVMAFADRFLEPPNLLGWTLAQKTSFGKLYQPTVEVMCQMMTSVAKEAVLKYLEEDGMESLAFLRLEQLFRNVMDVIEDHCNVSTRGSSTISRDRRGASSSNRTLLVEENASLRKLSASLNGDMTKLAERMLLLAGEDNAIGSQAQLQQFYVQTFLFGKKPDRFKESTTIPTFLEWENPSICRVPKEAVSLAFSNKRLGHSGPDVSKVIPESFETEERICAAFAEPFLVALSKDIPLESIVFRTEMPTEETLKEDKEEKTFLIVTLVNILATTGMSPKRRPNVDEILSAGGSNRFYFRNRGSASSGMHNSIKMFSVKSSAATAGLTAGLIELTVGQRFPCALSRQRTIITSEYYA